MDEIHKTNYYAITIQQIIGLCFCASFNCDFEGFICDGDNKSVLETYNNQHPHLLGE